MLLHLLRADGCLYAGKIVDNESGSHVGQRWGDGKFIVCTYTYIDLYIYIYMYIYMCSYRYLYIYTCMYIYMDIYRYRYIYLLTYICIHIYICIYIYIYLCRSIYIHWDPATLGSCYCRAELAHKFVCHKMIQLLRDNTLLLSTHFSSDTSHFYFCRKKI